MRRALLATSLAVLAAACSSEPLPRDDLALRIESDAYEVRLAEGFLLTVTRSWSTELAPEEWSDETLSPLIVRLVDTRRREDGTHVLETRRYVAHAAELGDVRVLPPLFVAERADGSEAVVTGEALDLRVLPVLAPADASAVELPGGMLRPRAPWGAWLAGLGALIGVALLATRALRPREDASPVEVEEGPPPEGPEVAALSALGAVDALLVDDDPRPLHDAVSDAVRTFLHTRFGVGSHESTVPELTDDLRAAAVPRADAFCDVLARCELVRFACVRPDADARARLVEDAVDVVRDSVGGAA